MIKGNYYDGGNSKLQPAVLIIEASNLHICDAEDTSQVILSVAVADTTISQRLGNTPRTIKFSDGSKFETPDNQAIDKLQKMQGKNNGAWLHLLESHYPIVFLMLVVTVGLTWGFIKFGIPATAKWAAFKLPPALYEQAGEHTLNYLDKILFEPSELPIERQAALRETFLQQLNDNERQQNITVLFRNGGEIGANAFALPSGIVLFTDQMVELACDDRELISIFGHEIGHIQQRHLTRRAIQGSIVGITLALLIGDASALGEVIVALPALLLEMNYSREFEREADDYALAFMQQRNIHTGYFTSIMSRLADLPTDEHKTEETPPGTDTDQSNQLESFENYLSTHPEPEERLVKFGPAADVACPQKAE